MGVHVTKYMNEMKKEDPEKFKRHFANWTKALDKAKVKTCEDLYKKVHAAIRANPERKKKAGNSKPTRKIVQKGFERIQENSKGKKWLRHFRIDHDTRAAKIMAKFQAAQAAAQE
jgi:large subunit ribosomal protein L5e